jgi:outer membrane receptor protein involved in Fe transport
VATLPQGKHYDYEVTANVAAVFAQFDYPATDRLDLSFGLRGEQVRYDYDNRMIAGRTQDDGTPCGFGGCRYTRPGDRKDNFTNVSPKAGFSLAFGAQILFGQVSQGFRAPQATELYRLQNGQTLAEIDSESADNIELGLRGDGDRFRYQISVYRMQKDNFIFQDTSRNNVDNGKTRHQGLELEASFALNDQTSVSAAWTLASHRYDNNPALARTEIKGNDIDTAPRSMGALQLTYAPSEALSGELEWSHIGPYFTNPDNTNRYGGHDLLHLRGDYQFNTAWSLFFRVTNLLDTDYAERADFAFGSERYFVGEPRSYFIGIRRRN